MADRHNLVVILSDQQRYDTMACYGNHWIQTPRLMRWPMRASYSRLRMSLNRCVRPHVSLLTGLHPHATGPIMNKMHLDPDITVSVGRPECHPRHDRQVD